VLHLGRLRLYLKTMMERLARENTLAYYEHL
jgi:hypothetical protein